MSNVLKAAEAKKADLEMKQRLDEEKNLIEEAKAVKGSEGPSPAKTEAGPLSRSRRPAIMQR